MAPKCHLFHVTKDYPFMTCVVKVHAGSSWQKTVRKVLNKCHGVYSFRMDENGVVEISGTVDPKLLLKMLEKAGSKAEVRWFQFGECSSNLFMPVNQDGRYLHTDNLSRPRPLSHQPLRSSSAHNPKHSYQFPFYHRHDYDQYAYHHYQHPYHHHHHYQHYDQRHEHDYQYKYGQMHNGNQTHYRTTLAGEDIGCCRVM